MNNASSGAVVNDEARVVTVWSDLGCPWASLALHVLRERARATGVPLLIDHRAFPLELFNERPTPKDILDVEVAAIAARVPEVGWRPWHAAESGYAVTTLPAMAAVQAAKTPEVGGLRGSDELDAALRHAFYVESRCISVHAEILAAAARCSAVELPALERALARGEGYEEVFGQWQIARGDEVQGSPHLFVSGRYAAHNPGVDFSWTAKPGFGFPRFDHYDPAWADSVLALLTGPAPRAVPSPRASG